MINFIQTYYFWIYIACVPMSLLGMWYTRKLMYSESIKAQTIKLNVIIFAAIFSIIPILNTIIVFVSVIVIIGTPMIVLLIKLNNILNVDLSKTNTKDIYKQIKHNLDKE